MRILQLGRWVLSTALLFAGAAQAQLGASPLVIEAQANRGQAQAIINIINTTNAPLRARIYTEPFTYSRDNGFQTLSSSSNDLSPYLQFSPRELTVPPGVNRRVRLIVRLAPSLPDGEYRTVVFSETLSEAEPDGRARVGLTTRVGTTIYIRKGAVSANLAVDSASFNLAQNQVQLLTRNAGQASARTSVTWTLKRGATVVRTGRLEPSTIMAQSERNLLLSYSSEGQPRLSPGTYQLTGTLAWAEDGKSRTLPFSVNLSVPINTSTR